MKALKNEKDFLPNVLCPFGCSEYCFKGKHLEWDLVIQRLLLKVLLPHIDKNRYRSVQHMWDQYDRKDNDYNTILLNKEWEIRPAIVISETGCPRVVTCRNHGLGSNCQVLYTPRYPDHHLSAKWTDQLSPIVLQPRIARTTRAKEFCTTLGMSRQFSHFTGIDSCDVGLDGNSQVTSELLCSHESISLAGRPDIHALLSRKVEDGQIPTDLSSSMIEESIRRFPAGSLTDFIQGSTYIPFIDSIYIQLGVGEDGENTISCVKSHGSDVYKCRRSWARTINIVQTEDKHRYGTQFRTIPTLNGQKDLPSMMVWSLTAMLSSIKELWRAVDNIDGPFRFDQWEGYILAWVQKQCFSYESIIHDSRSPFVTLKPTKLLRKFFELYPSLNNILADDPSSHFGYSVDLMKRLFPTQRSPTVQICSSVEEVMDLNESSGDHFDDKNIIICLSSSIPDSFVDHDECTLKLGNNIFELRYISLFESSNPNRNRSKWNSECYARHGGRYTSWWHQERGDHMATKYFGDISTELPQRSARDIYFFNCTYVYVKRDHEYTKHWRQRFFRCMGGKTHVTCKCNNMPFIPTNIRCEVKRKCMNCHRTESFVCCSSSCPSRLCKRCYDACPIDVDTAIDPADIVTDGIDGEDHDSIEDDEGLDNSVDDNVDDSDSIDISNEFNTDDDYDPFDGDDVEHDFLLYNDLDATHEITEDNVFQDHGFLTTNSGDATRNFLHHDRMERVSGHVLFNMAAACLSRYGRSPISGTQAQRHFIQRLASSISGESCPLLYMESSLFPRIFYHSSSDDSYSILGALPLFVYSSTKSNPYGLESFVKMNRSRVTNYGCLTSSCVNYIKYLHDIMSNKELCHSDSRDVTERGFVVDTKSPTGLSIRNKGESSMSESIDSHKMVRSLCASQEYIKYDLFLTFTCAQKDHPATSNLFQWKSSKEWLHSISGSQFFSEIEREELANSIEELYGLISFRNWMESRQLMLDFIFHDVSSHGACVALFSRTEYQKDSGNFPHEHTIIALKKDTLNSLTENKLRDLIATSVFEIVKTEEIAKLTADGLLSCPEDIDDITREGWRKLKHTCEPRCLMKIGPGDGPENYRCRKPHAFKDNPDPTSHQYIKIPCNLSDASKEILTRAGIRRPPSYEGAQDEHYSIPYFQPTRHMAPCITNAQCNMSPIIPIYFIMFKSMCNAQIISQTSGVSKYILKYIAKIDKCNYVFVFANGRNEDLRVGVQFLHNTKISTSAINESKALQNKRYKHHPTGTEIPDIQCLHFILGYSEVTTNLTFLPNNTGPFELRTQHTVRLDRRGSVIRNTSSDDAAGE